jgi:hypothetical protein
MRDKGPILVVFAVFVLLAASLTVLVPNATAENSDTNTFDSTVSGNEKTNFAGYIPITNVQELSDIRNDPTGKYYLTNDIIFPSGSGVNFEPISSFKGIFDGNGHIIDGLRTGVNALDKTAYSGLFRSVGSGSEIRNLGIMNSSSIATTSSSNNSAYAGGIAGYVDGGASITNCYNTGSVSASTKSSSSDAYAGGIIGYGSSTNCYNTGSVSASTSSKAYAGGISGKMSSPITNCYNTGSVSASSTSTSSSSKVYVGGIAGYNSNSHSSITNCYNTGSVSVTSSSSSPYAYVGGIIGAGDLFTTLSITNCYNTGSVSVTSSSVAYAGGIMGYGESISSYKLSITNCYNTGSISVTSSSACAGGIVGSIESLVTGCYNTGSISVKSSSSTAIAGGIVGSTSSPVTGCYNTGSVSASISSSSIYLSHNAYAGGIVGGTSSSVTNSYNTGSVKAFSSSISSSSSFNAHAGGIVGRASLSIINCYNAGSVSASKTSAASSSNAYAGGIIGSTLSTSSIINCYYLNGQTYLNGISTPATDALYGTGSPIVDDNDTSNRSTYDPDQQSATAKSLADMTPLLSIAAANGSIYFTGNTSIATGWDFATIWTIDESSDLINGGLPILRAFLFTVSITENPRDITATEGETASFSVSLSASPNESMLTYQWQMSADNGSTWNDILGASGQRYVIPATDRSLTGNLYRVVINVPGYKSTQIETVSAGLTVMPVFTVSGKVAVDGEGLAGAEVTYRIGSDSTKTTTTDANGNYSIKTLVGETMTITSVGLIGYAVSGSMPSPFSNDDTANFTMDRAYFTVSGKVAVDGEVLAGAEVTYRIGSDSTKTTTTDANGNYSITAQTNKTIKILSVKLSGYKTINSSSSFNEDTVENFNMDIAYFTVSGNIKNYEGKPTANMKVIYTIDGGSPQTAVTDIKGNYSITAQVGKTITMTDIELSGYNLMGLEPRSFTTDNSKADIVWWTTDEPFTDDFTVSGQVTSGDAGLAGVEVTYRIGSELTKTTTTDANGNYSITAQGGKTITIWYVEFLGYTTIYPSSSFTEDAVENFTMDIAYFTVSGNIKNYEGKPTANMKVIYTIDEGFPQTAVTDIRGNYSITTQVGKTITITDLELSGYNIMGLEPRSYTTNNSRADLVWWTIDEQPNGGSEAPVVTMVATGAIVGGIIGGIIGLVSFLYFRKH